MRSSSVRVRQRQRNEKKLDLASNDDISGTVSSIDIILAAFQNESFLVSNAVTSNGLRSFVAMLSNFELLDRSVGCNGKILVNVSINERSPVVIIVLKV